MTCYLSDDSPPDAVCTFSLQECSKNGTVMHSFVETRQPGGLVYVMFSTTGAAVVRDVEDSSIYVDLLIEGTTLIVL